MRGEAGTADQLCRCRKRTAGEGRKGMQLLRVGVAMLLLLGIGLILVIKRGNP